jgi:hypothetical protein
VTWLKDGRVRCDNHLTQIFDYPGPRKILIDAARVHGWVIHESATIGGKEMTLHLCPTCSEHKREPKTKRLAGETPLFELEEMEQ